MVKMQPYKDMSSEPREGELWRDIPGYEDLYQASNLGRVRSHKHILKQNINQHGYLKLALYKEHIPKTIEVHRLIAKAFAPNPQNKPCVNHLDENKLNNTATNLEWCTVAENNTYGTRLQRIAKKHNKRTAVFKGNQAWDCKTQKEAAELIGIDPTTIAKYHDPVREHMTKNGYSFTTDMVDLPPIILTAENIEQLKKWQRGLA